MVYLIIANKKNAIESQIDDNIIIIKWFHDNNMTGKSFSHYVTRDCRFHIDNNMTGIKSIKSTRVSIWPLLKLSPICMCRLGI